MSDAWKFYTKFAGRTGLVGHLSPDVRFSDPGWGSECFSRPIERMEFYLPTGHQIVMSGMEQYNFFVEASENIGGGGQKINAFWVCGKLPSRPVVEMWRIGEGRVIRQQAQWGAEWGGSATRGWKQGAPGKPVSAIMEG